MDATPYVFTGRYLWGDEGCYAELDDNYNWDEMIEAVYAHKAVKCVLFDEYGLNPLTLQLAKAYDDDGYVVFSAIDEGTYLWEAIIYRYDNDVRLSYSHLVGCHPQPLSEEEKAQARENIGVDDGKYELIETVTIETVSYVSRTNEPNGTPYNFSAVFFHILVPAGETNPSGTMLFYSDEKSSNYFAHRWTAATTDTSAPNSYAGRVYRDRGIWCWYLPGEFKKNDSSPIVYESTRADISDIVNEKTIRKILFNYQFPVGTVINIYGVRA